MGFDAVRWLWRYFLLGAVMVIPIWLILRLVRAPQRRADLGRPVSAVIAAASTPTRSASFSASPRSSAPSSAALISPTSAEAAEHQRAVELHQVGAGA